MENVQKLMELMKLMKYPRGSGLGLGALAAAGGLAYAAANSFYNVDGGHRAIIFSRITGVGDVVYREGLHFRIPWFQYPIVYDIRARPNQISSLTGSKGTQLLPLPCPLEAGGETRAALQTCRWSTSPSASSPAPPPTASPPSTGPLGRTGQSAFSPPFATRYIPSQPPTRGPPHTKNAHKDSHLAGRAAHK